MTALLSVHRRDLGVTIGLAAILLAVTSDYDLRVRDSAAQTEGIADWAILLELAVYSAVGGWALATILRRRSFSTRVSDRAVSLFVAYGLLMVFSSVWAPFPQLALARGGQLLVLILVAWLIASTPHVRRRMLGALCAASVALTTVSIPFGLFVRNPPAPPPGDPVRFSWFFLHPIPAAIYLGISCLVMTAVLANKDRWPLSPKQRLWLVVLLSIHLVALVATLSRGPIIAAASGVVVVLWVSSERHRRAILGLGLAGLVVATWLLFEDLFAQYFLRGQDVSAFISLSGRTDLWREAWDLFGSRPLFGHGFGSTRGLFLDTIGLGGAHSMVIELLINGGLAALVVYAGLFGSMIARMVRWTRQRSRPMPRDELAIALGVVTLLLVSGVAFEGAAAAINMSVLWLAALVGWTASATTTIRLSQRPLRDSSAPRRPTRLR